MISKTNCAKSFSSLVSRLHPLTKKTVWCTKGQFCSASADLGLITRLVCSQATFSETHTRSLETAWRYQGRDTNSYCCKCYTRINILALVFTILTQEMCASNHFLAGERSVLKIRFLSQEWQDSSLQTPMPQLCHYRNRLTYTTHIKTEPRHFVHSLSASLIDLSLDTMKTQTCMYLTQGCSNKQ